MTELSQRLGFTRKSDVSCARNDLYVGQTDSRNLSMTEISESPSFQPTTSEQHLPHSSNDHLMDPHFTAVPYFQGAATDRYSGGDIHRQKIPYTLSRSVPNYNNHAHDDTNFDDVVDVNYNHAANNMSKQDIPNGDLLGESMKNVSSPKKNARKANPLFKKFQRCKHCSKVITFNNMKKHVKRCHKESWSVTLPSKKRRLENETDNSIEKATGKALGEDHLIAYLPSGVKLKKHKVSLEKLNTQSLRIRPDDPIEERRRLTLEKDVLDSYKILDAEGDVQPAQVPGNDDDKESIDRDDDDDAHGSLKCQIPLQHIATENRNLLLENNQPEDLQCHICVNDKKFSTKVHLFKHFCNTHFKEKLLIFIDEENLTCKICSRKITRPENLRYHVAFVHHLVDDEIPSNLRIAKKTPVKVKRGSKKSKCEEIIVKTSEVLVKQEAEAGFPCRVCNEYTVFPSRSLLYNHYSTDHFKKELLLHVYGANCLLCGKKFANRGLAIAHTGAER